MSHEQNDDFLTRFLSDVDNGIPPSLTDLKAVANALIQMHDYGVSFKRAFCLADKRGQKSKQTTLISDSFQSMMNNGFLGNPLFLCGFLCKAGQGQQPNTKDLKLVANALLKMRDNNESIKSVFGLLQKTSHKTFDDVRLHFFKSKYSIYKSEKWLIYHTYKKHRKSKNHADTIHLMSEKLSKELREKGKSGGSDRQIERIVKEVKEEVDRNPFYKRDEEKQRKLWSFYFKNRKYLVIDNLIESIKNISIINQCSEKDVYTKLITLYDEVLIRKRFILSVWGKPDYPKRLKNHIKKDLKIIYDFIMLSRDMIQGLELCYEYNALIQIKIHSEIIKILSEHRQIDPIVLEAFFKKRCRG